MLHFHTLDDEEARIKAAYARRAAKGDQHLYAYFNRGTLFIVQDRERQTLALVQRYGLSGLERHKILEVGCRSGHWLREFIKWGACPENMAGPDLLPERIAEASHIHFPDASFDIVLQ